MQIDSRLTFENFVVGSANRLAVAAAHAVAESPARVYNPLFIYGQSGLGKTHLISAVANHVAAHHAPPLAIELASLDELLERVHAAIGAGRADEVKAQYEKVGLLLIDDMQFLSGRPETQTELLRIFNGLTASGGQIVMTSDRAPADIADVDERLLTRMAGGLIVDIGLPDYETRSAIVRARCDERGVRFRSGVIEELARVSFRNIRELQGALNRLIAMQTLGDHQVSPEEVQGMLGDLAEPNAKTPLSRASSEFQALVTEVESAVSRHVERWRGRLAEAIAYWSGEGYRTAMLDRALQGELPPQSVEGFLREYESSVNRLIELEAKAREIDVLLASNAVFRDPERVTDAEALVQRAQRLAAPPPGPSGAFTRGAFEVGAANQLAARAADAVVSEPGTRYNPLFIHGPSGVGKTHLLNAVGNALLTTGRAGAVACVPAHAFVDELIAALQEGTVDRWRLRYRDAAALLLDDVQFVEGKERTQEELFHAFNALHREGKQLVFTSDRPPRELSGLEDRLRSRFEGGLVVEMEAPDPTLRERLYARFLQEQGVTPEAELLRYLAGRPTRSAREILGTVNALVSAAEVAGKPVGLKFARSHLDGHETPALGVAAVPAKGDAFFYDREKVVWQWSDPSARLVEDMR